MPAFLRLSARLVACRPRSALVVRALAVAGLVLLPLAARAPGQAFGADGPHAAGRTDLALPNPLPGTAKLRIQLRYPALATGVDAPPDTAHGPYPLVIFGHGLGNGPEPYGALLDHLATWGFLVAAPDTATWGPQALLAEDLLGTAAALATLAQSGGGGPASLSLPGVVGLAGHSMGGGAALIAASLLPDCDGVLALAPWSQPGALPGVPSTLAAAALLHVPLAIIVGADDTVTPVTTNAQPLYAAATAVTRLRLLSVVAGAGHNDPLLISEAGNDGTAFLRAYLADDGAALDEVYGPSAAADPLASLTFDVPQPDCFVTGSPTPQGLLGVHAAASPGSLLVCVVAATHGTDVPAVPCLQLPPGALLVLSAGHTDASQVVTLQLALPSSLLGLPQLTWFLQAVRVLPGGAFDCSPLRTLTLLP